MSSSVKKTAQEHLNRDQYYSKELKNQLTYNSKLGSIEREDNPTGIKDKFITRSRGKAVVVGKIKMKEYDAIVKAFRTYQRMAMNKLKTGQYAMLNDANKQKMQAPISFISTGSNNNFSDSKHEFGGSSNAGGSGGGGSGSGGSGAGGGTGGGYYNFGVGTLNVGHGS